MENLKNKIMFQKQGEANKKLESILWLFARCIAAEGAAGASSRSSHQYRRLVAFAEPKFCFRS